MVSIYFCFTGAYIAISGNADMLACAIGMNIMIILNGVGAVCLFQPIAATRSPIARDDEISHPL
ncbi:hypothetical protein [uncultured Thalassospira sp.]|jgi:hypothetical protein|uniref:hypothetical protein n=1 Tax=uncultured Thalassospira sp. TaxID=404382 RepID=UPI0030DD454B